MLSQMPSNDVHLLFRITLMEHNYLRLQHTLALECIKINLELQKIRINLKKIKIIKLTDVRVD